MSTNYKLGEIVDAATGYVLKLSRVEHDDYTVTYDLDVHRPAGADVAPGDFIDGVETVPLLSDGTGPKLEVTA